jgi:alkanesulfonate monooxygenase SsuD/methylene tetrahydromethanopterin reductase-like flavin-dependent oxidoreductase (luciferase family)
MSSAGPEQCVDAFSRLDTECHKIGRDPASVHRSVMAGLLMGADEAEVERRVAGQIAMVGAAGADAKGWFEARRPRWIAGTPDQARAMVARFAAAGIERIMLQDLLPRDHAMIQLAGKELIGRV